MGIFARAVIAGGKHANDATLVGLIGGDVDRIQRLELARAAPGVADHPNRVVKAKLIAHRVVDTANRVEDQQHGTGAVADQISTRGHARMLARRRRTGTADAARTMSAVTRTPIGVDDAFQVADRQQIVIGVQVQRGLHVFHHVAAKAQIRVGCIDARIIDHHGHPATAVGHSAIKIARILGDPGGAGQLTRVGIEIAQRLVEVDGNHVIALRQGLNFRRSAQRTGNRQAAHGHALFQAQGFQVGDLCGGQWAGLAIADHHLEFVGGQGADQRGAQTVT